MKKDTVRLGLIAFLGMSALALTARADVPPPDRASCDGKAVGSACTFEGENGTCRNSTCSGWDYAHWDRDAGGGPPTTTYDCVKCITGKNVGDGGDSPTPDGGTCSIGKQMTAKHVAPWLLAAAFSSLFMLNRRRRR